MIYLNLYLLEINWGSLMSGIGGTLVLTLLAWLRFRKKDDADVDLTNANTTSLLLKSDAESAKIKAEAKKIAADADSTIVETATKLAIRLSEECDMTKKELKEKEERLDKTQEDLSSVKLSLTNALQKVKELEDELTRERQKNEDMSNKNEYMSQEIIKLRGELKKLQDDRL